MNSSRPTPRHDPARDAPLLAALDLGTNNCRLLIARPAPSGFKVVDSFSCAVRLGEQVAATGRLSDAALDRTMDALKVCGRHIAEKRVRHVRAIATQAARLAENRAVLVGRAKAEAGIDLEVISAEEEAMLAALGCAPLVGRKYRGALVFDIGGGSTEIIWLSRDNGKLNTRFSASLPVGVVTLSESHGAMANSRSGFDAMRSQMRTLFAPMAARISGFAPASQHLLGTSGTVTTLAAVALGLPRYSRAKVDGSWHTTAQLLETVERLSHLDVNALAAIGAVGNERADLMLAGSAIFAAVCTLWPSPMLRVADRGLREGMLRQMQEALP